MYRIPTDTQIESHQFYQQDYSEGATTECPDEAELLKLKEGNFSEASNSYGRYLEVLQHLGYRRGTRVFDFGCSWGYGSYQMVQVGYSVTSYEVSAERRAYAAERLGVDTVSDLSRAACDFDVFFSAHVLEHVPDLQEVIRLAKRITKPGGLFIAFTPNGSLDYRNTHREAFHKSWGLVHPNVLQDKFYRHLFVEQPYLLASDPYPASQISSWNKRDQLVCDLSGGELLAVAVL